MRSTNTLPERLLAEALSARGLDFTTHDRGLPGTPDLVFKNDRLAVFVHGCYWHRHHGCERARLPKTDTVGWLSRFGQTVSHDQAVANRLRKDGWLVHVAWECDVLADPGLVALDVARARAAHAMWLVSSA